MAPCLTSRHDGTKLWWDDQGLQGQCMPWRKAMALQELTETSRLYLRCITCVAPLTLLLFANLLSETMETWEIHTLLKCRNGKHDEPDEPWDFDGFCGCSLFGQT